MSDQLELVPETMPKGRVKNVNLDRFASDLPGQEPTAELVANIEKFGVVFPVVVVQRGDRYEYEVVDGRRRIAAARKLDMKQVPARVYEDDGLLGAGEVLTISLNRLRSSNPIAELHAIQALLERGATLEEIKKATGLPKATIDKRLQLTALDSDLREGVAEGKIAVSVAEAAAKLPDGARQRLRQQFENDGNLTMKDVKAEKSARAVNELDQLPADVFAAEAPPWRDTVIARLSETLKLVPEQEDGARSRLAELIDWLAEG